MRDTGAAGTGPVDDANRTWREIIRTERKRLGLTQVELARRAELDENSVRKYESGDRQPTRERLERILGVLQVPFGTAHRALVDRGFHSEPFRFDLSRDPGYYFTIDEARRHMDEVPWPAFTGNELGETAAANRPAQLLWGIDLEAELARRSRAQANLFVAMAEHGIFERMVNWDDVLRHFVALLKKVPASQNMLEDPGALFTDIIESFAAANPAALGRLFELWQTTPARNDKVRWIYPVVWREPGFPEMRFLGMVTPASEIAAIGFNDWIPADPASFATLATILESRGGGMPAAPAPRRRPPSTGARPG